MTRTTERNLGTDISEAKKGLSKFSKAIFGEREDFNRLAYFNNPHSMLDGLLYLLWFVLAGSTAFTIYYGIKYHSTIFTSEHTSAFETQAITFGILVIGEIIMIFIGHKFVRTVFSMLWFKGLPEAVFVIALGAVTFFTFQWSIGISTNGYSLTTANAEKKSAFAKTGDYSASTSLLDKQLEDQQKTIQSARKITWHGKLTWEGQQVIKNANATIQKLSDQRQSAINDAKLRDSSFLSLSNVNITEAAIRTSDYGGKAEILKIFCLFMLGLIEQITYRQNKKQIEKKDDEEAEPKNFFKLGNNKSTAFAKTDRSPITFKDYNNSVETVVTNEQKSVVTAVEAVVTAKTPVDTVSTEFEQGDKLLRSIKSDFQKELNNLKVKHGNPDTIKKRIAEKLKEFNYALNTVTSTDHVRKEICAWVGREVVPLV